MNDRRAYDPRPLPPAALAVCDALGAPPRLVAHLRLVHDCAAELVEAIHQEFPRLRFDPDAVLFGAATHDIGKTLHPQELIGPGAEHEAAGPGLLERLGVPPALARAVLQPLDVLRLSPFVAWHYRTQHHPFYFDTSKLERELDFRPRLSNLEMLIDAFDWHCAHGSSTGGSAHRRPLRRGLLRALGG